MIKRWVDAQFVHCHSVYCRGKNCRNKNISLIAPLETKASKTESIRKVCSSCIGPRRTRRMSRIARPVLVITIVTSSVEHYRHFIHIQLPRTVIQGIPRQDWSFSPELTTSGPTITKNRHYRASLQGHIDSGSDTLVLWEFGITL